MYQQSPQAKCLQEMVREVKLLTLNMQEIAKS